MKLNRILNVVGTLAVACTVIPGAPAWVVTVLSAVALSAGKLASTPLDHDNSQAKKAKQDE